MYYNGNRILLSSDLSVTRDNVKNTKYETNWKHHRVIDESRHGRVTPFARRERFPCIPNKLRTNHHNFRVAWNCSASIASASPSSYFLLSLDLLFLCFSLHLFPRAALCRSAKVYRAFFPSLSLPLPYVRTNSIPEIRSRKFPLFAQPRFAFHDLGRFIEISHVFRISTENITALPD